MSNLEPTPQRKEIYNDSLETAIAFRRAEYNGITYNEGIFTVSSADLIDEITLNKFTVRNQPEIISILFEGCSFKGSVHIDSPHGGKLTYNFEIRFIACTFEKTVQLRGLIKLTIDGDSVFNDSLTIHLDSKEDLEISNITALEKIQISGNYNGKLSLQNINKDSKLGFGNGKSILGISNSNIKFLEARNLCFENVSIDVGTQFIQESSLQAVTATTLDLNRVEIQKILTLNACKIVQLRIANLSANRRISIENNTVIDSVKFDLSQLIKTEISNSVLLDCTIHGTNEMKGIFSLENCTITILTLKNIYNHGLIIFRNLKVTENATLRILSSTLGKTDFILCNFSNAILDFQNTKLSELFLSETDFPAMVGPPKNRNWRQSRLVASQLHTVFQKQGDTIRSLEYQAREIEAHFKDIHWFYKKRFKKIPLIGKNRTVPIFNFTKFALWLNKYSNDFGRNWFQGAYMTFGIGAVLFYFLVLSLKQYDFGFPIEWNWTMLVYYLKFMNPIRFFDIESLFKPGISNEDLEVTTCSYLLDFFSRIVLAYGFYQTIQAFRRFGRK